MTLADRIEAAEGPSRELDAEIAKAVGVKSGPDSGFCNSDNGDYWVVDECAPDFTSSIDAALSLVPEGWAWMTGCYPGEAFFCSLSPTDESGIDAEMIDTTASTPSLAICAAALRAREAQP